MLTTYKCIRVKEVRKPLQSRCGKPLGKNGILCDSCYAEAKKGKIPVLMCADVSNTFNVKFHNQVFVYIDLTPTVSKEDTIKDTKLKLRNDLDLLDIGDLFVFAADLKISVKKSSLKDDNNRKDIIDKIIGKLTNEN
jgi:hypothetical protein